MQSFNKKGMEQVNEAKNHIQNKNYKSASNLLGKAIKNFEKAIENANLNAGTNFVYLYEQNKRQAKELLNQVNRNYFSNDNIDVDEIINNEKAIETNDDNIIEKPLEPELQDNQIKIEEENHEETIPLKPEKTKYDKKSEDEETEQHQDINEKDDNKEFPKDPVDNIKKIPFPEVYNDIIVKLGKDEDNETIYWKPKVHANQHFVAVGMSGTGKTTAVRTILYQLKNQDVPLIIFDLHDDFEGDKIINFGDITINPLELDGLTPKEKAIEFAYICKRIFKLGDQQENKLREAIMHCYGIKGITQLDKSSYNYKPPTLLDVNDYLEANRDGKTIDTLLGRVKFFHRIELFMSETRCPFIDMFKGSTVIKLIEFSDNPDLQTALCEIFLNKLLFTVKKAGQSKLRAYCVIDEAHILDDGKDSYRSPLVKIAREARKYGLGLILASQMPKDFSKSVLHNTATIMSLKFNAAEEARAVSQQMYGLSEEDILNLGEIGEGYIKLSNEVKKVKFFRKEEL